MKHYDDDTKAAALAALRANGGRVRQTAREMGIGAATLISWREAERSVSQTHKNGAAVERLSDLYEAHIRNACERLPAALTNANALAIATVIGILTDKMQLLKGAPTDIVVTNDATRRERQNRIDELLERRGRSGATPAAGDGGESATVQ